MDLEKVIIGTGSYDNVKSGNTVSISGDGGVSANYDGPSYKKLAPKLVTYNPYAAKRNELETLKYKYTNIKQYYQFKEEIIKEYIDSYYECRLKDLDAYELLETLYNKFGEGIILLCYENPEEFCHRRLIADYIELQTGIYIPEVTVNYNRQVRRLKPISYKEELLKRINKD